MTTVFVDQGNYAFVRSAAASVLARGDKVVYLYAASCEGRYRPAGPSGSPLGAVPAIPVGPYEEMQRSNLVQRYFQEQRLAKAFTSAVAEAEPSLVIGVNNALPVQAAVRKWCAANNCKFCFWLQDLRGAAAGHILAKKFGPLGRLIGRHYTRIEESLARSSHHTIALAESFREFALAAGAHEHQVTVLPNWAILEEQPRFPKVNPWSVSSRVDKTFNFLYSGLLGLKHSPEFLLALAIEFQRDPTVRIIAVAEGPGAAFLQREASARGLHNVIVRPFLEDTRDLPIVLASADVLVGTLEASAVEYCVPSKILTYLCAGRPLLVSAPPSNSAARLVSEVGCGMATDAASQKAFLDAAWLLRKSSELRESFGRLARDYAEREFEAERVAKRFNNILERAGLLDRQAAAA